MNDLVIVGAGGHAREIIQVFRAIEEVVDAPSNLIGALDDVDLQSNRRQLRAMNVPFLGAIDAWLRERRPTRYVVGVASPHVRRRLAARFDDFGHKPAKSLVHPQATIAGGREPADGSVIFAGARVSVNVTVGTHVHINQNVTIGHDTVIDPFASINPNAAISGNCKIGNAVLVGAGAVVLQGLEVHEEAVVGACACVVRDVPVSTVVKGVPAR
jgi:sugar O-acyltransferase (sialic acid O-acetyltransferase NeuD family)